MSDKTEALEGARRLLEGEGYVVLKRKSYEDAQRRQHRAEGALEWAQRDVGSYERWAQESLDEARRLRDRLTFVYGIARARGASVAELCGVSSTPKTDLQEVALNSQEVMEFVRTNKKIQAIKALRDVSPTATLKEAKDAVESEAVWGNQT